MSDDEWRSGPTDAERLEAIRALCREMRRWPVQTPTAIALHVEALLPPEPR